MTPPLDRRACLEGSVSEGQPSIGDELTAVHQAHVGAHVVVGHTKLSTRNALADLARGRSRFTTDEWKRLLLRSVGFEPERLDERQRDVLLLRMLPFVVRNFNMVELGPLAPASPTCSNRSRRTRT